MKEIEIMQYELFFQNPVFHKGLNVTIRNGDKWMRADINDYLLIKEEGKNAIIATSILVGKALLPAYLIPEDLLKYDHDPACRNLANLFSEMRRMYPDFSERNLVTVLLFNL